MTIKRSQLSADILSSILSLNPTIHGDSSARSGMFAAHCGQSIPVTGGTTRMLKTGQEYEYAKGTFMVSAPCDMVIIDVLQTYAETYGRNSIKQNPEVVVLYERLSGKRQSELQTHVLGVMRIPSYHRRQHALGFKYKRVEANMARLNPGEHIKQGTIFAHSPNMTPSGDYKFGRETNVCFMSIPEVEQDGMVVTESFASAMSFDKIEARIASWGDNKILLNIYGDEENYKPFPDIGEKIRGDGLLFAIRTIEPGVGLVNMSPKALMKVDPIFDNLIYAEPGAVVSNINIKSDRMRSGRSEVMFYDQQAARYEYAARNFSIRLRDNYERFSRSKPNLSLEPELSNMIADAISDTGGLDRRISINKEVVAMDKGLQVYNKQPIGDWRAEITFVKHVSAGTRFKISDSHGGKGVIVKVIPDADAPIDDFGNRADVIMDNASITKRMNLGKPTEQYINGASRYARKVAGDLVASGDWDGAWNHLMSYYEAASIEQYELMMAHPLYKSKQARDAHVKWVVENELELLALTDRRYYGAEQVRRIMKNHDYPRSPVWYRACTGEMVRTHDKILIAPMYIILLEKMGEYWASCAMPKLTHFGTLSTITQSDKYALPWRNTPTRFCGESEIRLFLAGNGGWFTNRLLSFANTPNMQKEAIKKILTAQDPVSINSLIDEKVTPLGCGRPLAMYKHVQACRGIRFVKGVL